MAWPAYVGRPIKEKILGTIRFESGPLTTDCWIWVGKPNTPKGYARILYKGRKHLAHRVSYEEFVGPIPNGLQLDHLCRKTMCVNPLHLEPVTLQVNVGRSRVGQPQAARTHCPHGHEYTMENTYIDTRGCRSCRACKQIWGRNKRPKVRYDKVKGWQEKVIGAKE